MSKSPRNDLLALLGWAVCLLAAACQAAGPAYTPVFAEQPCSLPVPAGYTVRCGTVSVPEDRENPGGQQVTLHVAVAETTGATPGLPPVMMLNGGPGDSSLGNLAGLLDLFSKVNAERPVIFYDQRGTGFSEPALDCPEISAAQYEIATHAPSPSEGDRIYADAYAACKARLEQAEVSLAAYTSAASADDIRDIVSALNYPKVYLYGISYGTYLAQVTMLRHQSEDWIAGAILDSVVPLQVKGYQAFWLNAQGAFDELFMRCAAEPKCAARYPDLQGTFYTTMEQLKTTPLEIETFDPLTGKPMTVKLDDWNFFNALFVLMYDSHDTAKLPQIIEGAHLGDASVVKLPIQNALAISAFNNEGMWTSVLCTTEGLNMDLESIEQSYTALAPVYQELSRQDAEEFQSLCESWGVQPADPAENQALKTDLPLLILAGSQDPATPAAWGELLKASIPSAYFFEFPGIGHGVFPSVGRANICAESLILGFLNDSTQPPEGDCVTKIKPLPFAVPSK